MNPFEFAAQFRYSEDKSSEKHSSIQNQLLEILEAHNSLLITKAISPIIYASLERVAEHLHIDPDRINLYVFGSSEVNAKCYNGIDDAFVVILNSSLVTLLDEKELDFVVGHELGHLLLEHTKERVDTSPEGMKLSRAKELSVDRIGLVASRDLDAALRSVIKTISGLPSELLKFNVSEFLNQLRMFETDASSLLDQTTHPSFLLRARALLLFSTSDKYQELFNCEGKAISDVDTLLKREMDKHIDKSFNERAENLKGNFDFWLTCFAAVSDNLLSKEEQNYIETMFGKEKLEKLKSLISERSPTDIQNLINQKLLEASNELANYRGLSINKDIDATVQELIQRFNIPDLDQKVIQLFESST